MNNKNIKLPVLIIAIGLVVAVAAYLLTGILQVPTITEHDFNYSATSRLGEETKTIEGVYRCKFEHTGGGIDPLERYYSGYYLADSVSGDPDSHIIAQKGDDVLRVVFIFNEDYLMGDGEPGEEYSDMIPDPYLAVYDKEGYEYSDSEHLAEFDAEMISWETPQPIENSFKFIGFSYLHSTSMAVMLLAGLLTMLVCIIFVKKEESLQYKVLDKISTVLNFIIGFGALPFMAVVIFFMAIYVSGEEVIYQINLCIPAITAYTIAASIALRRKGYTKTGFFIQFAGPALFVLTVILETLITA